MLSSCTAIDVGSEARGLLPADPRFERVSLTRWIRDLRSRVYCAPVRPRFFLGYIVAAGGLSLVATSCSSSHPATTTAPITPTTNTGLCKLVAPSVVATALSESMTFPETLAHNSSTECIYRSKQGTGTAVLIRYDTDSNSSTFAKSRDTFERRGEKLGPITGLGDQAFYFTEQSGQVSVTTVVLSKGHLQMLITGSATLNQIGSIARYALNQYEAKHSPASSSS